jgi:ubiquitin-activating enzyme E1
LADGKRDIFDQFKSAVACDAAMVINSDLNLTAYREKVAPETEHIFGDNFYNRLDGICTALDNVEARLYVDQKCLFYRLPMLESGTLGTKGNTQVVVPNLTENYGATRDPPEKSIPVCTLKNFPNRIEHTLQWARDYFEGVFKQNAEDVNSYLNTTSLDEYADMLQKEPNTMLDTLQSLRNMLVVERPVTFEDCIMWARLQFQELFVNNIRQLLHNFPPGQLTSKGSKFWSGSKRCPYPLVFDLDERCDEARMRNQFNFFVAASNLRAKMFGIKGRMDEEYFRKIMKDISVPEFLPRNGVKLVVSDEVMDDVTSDNRRDNSNSEITNTEEECTQILRDLPKPSELAGFKLNPIVFDKDFDDHMLFVTACSNLRAMNYSIPTMNTHQSRAIAGRIIPAIATTTALVSGLVCLELYKIAGTVRKDLSLNAYKNCFVNLAIPFMTFSEPSTPEKTKAILKGADWNWTAWDSIDVTKGDISLRQLMKYFETEYNLEISMLSHGVSILYSFFANKKKVEERMNMSLSKIITSITRKEFPSNQLFIILELIANDLDTGEEVDIPYVKFRFR